MSSILDVVAIIAASFLGLTALGAAWVAALSRPRDCETITGALICVAVMVVIIIGALGALGVL